MWLSKHARVVDKSCPGLLALVVYMKEFATWLADIPPANVGISVSRVTCRDHVNASMNGKQQRDNAWRAVSASQSHLTKPGQPVYE